MAYKRFTWTGMIYTEQDQHIYLTAENGEVPSNETIQNVIVKAVVDDSINNVQTADFMYPSLVSGDGIYLYKAFPVQDAQLSNGSGYTYDWDASGDPINLSYFKTKWNSGYRGVTISVSGSEYTNPVYYSLTFDIYYGDIYSDGEWHYDSTYQPCGGSYQNYRIAGSYIGTGSDYCNKDLILNLESGYTYTITMLGRSENDYDGVLFCTEPCTLTSGRLSTGYTTSNGAHLYESGSYSTGGSEKTISNVPAGTYHVIYHRDNSGAGSSYSGETNVGYVGISRTAISSSYTYTINVKDYYGNNVPDATVTLWSAASNGRSITAGVTNSSGVYTYTTSSDSYPTLYAVVSKSGYDSNSSRMPVNKNNHVNVTVLGYYTVTFQMSKGYLTYRDQPVGTNVLTFRQNQGIECLGEYSVAGAEGFGKDSDFGRYSCFRGWFDNDTIVGTGWNDGVHANYYSTVWGYYGNVTIVADIQTLPIKINLNFEGYYFPDGDSVGETVENVPNSVEKVYNGGNITIPSNVPYVSGYPNVHFLNWVTYGYTEEPDIYNPGGGYDYDYGADVVDTYVISMNPGESVPQATFIDYHCGIISDTGDGYATMDVWCTPVWEESTTYWLDLNFHIMNTSGQYQTYNGYPNYGSPEGIHADVYIDGAKVANDVNDYYKSHPEGTSWRMNDFTNITGFRWAARNSFTQSSGISGTLYGDTNVDVYYERKAYTLAYNYNGGKVGNATSTSVTRYYDQAYGTFPTSPTRDHYTFAGWFTDSTGGTQAKTTDVMGDGSVTLYAHWTPDSYILTIDASVTNYTVTFTPSTGAGTHTKTTSSRQSISVTYGTEYSITWASGTNEGSETHTITWDAQGGTAVSSTTTSCTRTRSATQPNTSGTMEDDITVGGNTWRAWGSWSHGSVGTLPTTAKSGYSFDGWYTAASGGTKITTDTVPTSNVIYYAHWTANSHTVFMSHWTWGWQNGEGDNTPKTAYNLNTTSKTASYGSSVTLSTSDAVTIPNGFYLRGSIGSSYTGSWTGYDLPYTFTMPDADALFEYDYDPYEYSITYNLNGGTAGSNAPSTYNVIYGATLVNPTRTRYTFAGWYENSSFSGSPVSGYNTSTLSFKSVSTLRTALNARTTGNKTLYAKWNPNYAAIPTAISLTYNGNSQTGINGYDSNKMTIASGSISATNVGSYTVTFKIKSNYMWSDGTTTNKSVTFTIAKATASLPSVWQGVTTTVHEIAEPIYSSDYTEGCLIGFRYDVSGGTNWVYSELIYADEAGSGYDYDYYICPFRSGRVGTTAVQCKVYGNDNYNDSPWSSTVYITNVAADDAYMDVVLGSETVYNSLPHVIATGWYGPDSMYDYEVVHSAEGIGRFWLGYNTSKSNATDSEVTWSGPFTETTDLTAVNAGDYYIYYKFEPDGNHTNSQACTYVGKTVIQKLTNTKFSISPTSATLYSSTGYNTVTITLKNVIGTVDCTSSAPSIASVTKIDSSTYKVTYESSGNATITITDNGDQNRASATKTCAITCIADTVSNGDYNASNSDYKAYLTVDSTIGYTKDSTKSYTASADHLHTYYNLWASGLITGPYTRRDGDTVDVSINDTTNFKISSSNGSGTLTKLTTVAEGTLDNTNYNPVSNSYSVSLTVAANSIGGAANTTTTYTASASHNAYNHYAANSQNVVITATNHTVTTGTTSKTVTATYAAHASSGTHSVTDSVSVSITNTSHFSITNTSGSGTLKHTYNLPQPETNSDYDASDTGYWASAEPSNGLTAGGGSITVNALAGHTHNRKHYYAAVSESTTITATNANPSCSNVTSSKTVTASKTAQTSANDPYPVSDTPVVQITSQTFEGAATTRFSVNASNNITHSSMTSNVGTDSVKFKVKNNTDGTLSSEYGPYTVVNELETTHYKNTTGATGDNWDRGTPTTPTVTNNTKTNWCSGGSGTLSSSVKDSRTYYRRYTSGTYTSQYSESNITGSVTFVKTSDTGNAFSGQGTNWTLSGDTLSHRHMGTDWVTEYCTVVAKNANDSSKTSSELTLTASNTRLDSNPSEYWASCSIGDGLEAYASSATVTYSAGHKANYTYASGSTDSTKHPVTDECTIAITTNGSNRFSLAGSTLSHRTMGTDEVSDTVVVTATNSSSTSAKGTASKTISNDPVGITLTLNPDTVTYGNSSEPIVEITYSSNESKTVDTASTSVSGKARIYTSNANVGQLQD